MYKKKRILFVGEASFLHTGFATYYRELLPRLAATGKYDLAEIGCVPDPFALIEMADGGMKPISNIAIGDKVISHTGVNREVTQIHRKQYSGQLTKISRDFLGGKTLEVTSNHPVYAIKKDKAYIDRCFNRDAEPQWVEAGDLSVGDFVAYTVPKATTNVTTKVSNGDVTIDLDDDFAFFAGWFLAEGFVGKDKALGLNHFGICASLEEEHIIQRIKDVISRVFNIKCDYHRRDDMGVFEIKVANRPIAKFLCDMFGTSSHDKLINYAIFSAPHSFLLKMLATYAEGDGTSSISRNDIVIKTASNRLAIDVVRLLYRTGIRAGLNKTRPRFGRKTYNVYMISIAGEHARRLSSFFTYKNAEFDDLTREETFWIDNVLFCRVSQIHRRDFDGTVYNFAVQEDESYICNNFVVHNSYARQDDPKVAEFIRGRWKFYGVMPRTQQENAVFNQPSPHPRDRGQNINQFGAHVFDSVVADFKPDIVVDIRDNWMLSWQLRSPFRPWFKLVWMPTVDAEPQQEEWISDYEQAEVVLSYSDYGINTLRRQSPNIKVFPKAMRPGVDLETFKPLDRDAVREEFFLRKDLPIIGSCMRNQSRKLFPDLIDAFARMKNLYAKDSEVIRRATLLLHSSWPDNQFSYDYPRHIMRLQTLDWMPNHRKGIKNDILQTLMCHNPACGAYTVTPAMNLYGKPIENGRIVLDCVACGQKSATCPSSGGAGFTREGLSKVYNLMDLYVQCSICVHPDTMVRTIDGLKSISEINIGDDVLTHLGEYQQVTDLMINEPNDDVVDITVWGDNIPLTITENHPVLTRDGIWKRVADLTTDDWLVYNFDQSEIDVQESKLIDDDMSFDGKNVWHKTDRYHDNGKRLNLNRESFDWSNALNSYIAGLYLAEGSATGNYVSFASNEDEAKIHDAVRQFSSEFGIDVSERHRAEHGHEMNLSCLPLARLFKVTFGASATVKTIPPSIMRAPLNIQANILRGMFDGDGHYGSGLDRYYTSSPILARQVRDLLLRFGIVSSITKNCRDEFYVTIKEKYSRYLFARKIRGVDKVPPDKPSRDIFLSIDREAGVLFSRVRFKTNSEYAGPVYNIEVENKKGGSSSPDAHSYMLSSFAIHNCEGDG